MLNIRRRAAQRWRWESGLSSSDRSSISEPAAGTGTPRVALVRRPFFSDFFPRLAQRSNTISGHACIQPTACVTFREDLLSFVS
jgi:hypothetical protein